MEKKYPIGGYAPGNYHNRCSSCEKFFLGDKQAIQCEPCALANKARFDSLSPNEQEALVKQNIGIARVMFAYAGSGEQIISNQVAGMSLEEAVYQAGYSTGHDIGYERGKREAAQQGAVWVKASTRLPASWHLKCVRFIHTRLPLLDTEAFLEHNPKNVDLIEWLDESGQSQPEMAE